jgi:N-acetylmuramoyl-L-alanine amidase
MVTGRLRRPGFRAPLISAFLAAFAFSSPSYAQQVTGPTSGQSAVAAQHLDGRHADAGKARTKFIIGLERHVDFQVFALTNPNRVFVELPDVKLQLPQLPGNTPIGLVKSFRGGQSAPGKARVVIDVTGAVVVEKAAIEKSKDGKSSRLVIDIASAGGAEPALPAKATDLKRSPPPGASALGAAGLQPPLPKPAVSPSMRALGMYKPVIVIDPGHGGDDTGAQKNGAIEKNVVLAFSLKLRDKLNATGRYKVLMTRETDVFVELNERRQFAEQHQAALFIAVHADYTGRASARGATIYSLREGVANELKRSAQGQVSDSVLSAKELATMQKAEADVGAIRSILSDLAKREVETTKDRTSVFARSVVSYMGETTSMMDNPDRSAAFVVLKTAKVPSVLIELGFVTNESDAELLKSDSWRDKVSGSILTAIENYFSHQNVRLPM